MKTFEEDMMIQEYIYDFCESKNISIDLRFRCFGDTDIFYENNILFCVDYESYYAKNIDGIKQFFADYLNILSVAHNHKIALAVKDIIDRDGWYEIIVGSCLFKDETWFKR